MLINISFSHLSLKCSFEYIEISTSSNVLVFSHTADTSFNISSGRHFCRSTVGQVVDKTSKMKVYYFKNHIIKHNRNTLLTN